MASAILKARSVRPLSPQEEELARQLVIALHLGRTPAWDAALEQKVLALTADDVTAAFRRYIKADALTIVRAGDFTTAAGAAGPASGEAAVAAP